MNDSLQVATEITICPACNKGALMWTDEDTIDCMQCGAEWKEEEELFECDACGDAYPESEMAEPFLAYYSHESGPEYGQLCLKCENEAEAQEEAWEEARAEDAQEYARYQYEELK